MTEDEWFAYLDNPATAPAGLKVETHLENCPCCRETLAVMREVERALTSSAAHLRADVKVSPAAILAAKQKALARLGDHSLSIRLERFVFAARAHVWHGDLNARYMRRSASGFRWFTATVRRKVVARFCGASA